MEINLLYHIDNLFVVNSLFYECCNFWERSARPYLELYLMFAARTLQLLLKPWAGQLLSTSSVVFQKNYEECFR